MNGDGKTELLPCPFCGCDPAIFPAGEPGSAGEMIQCLSPGCVAPHTSWYGKGGAVRRWNRRSPVPDSTLGREWVLVPREPTEEMVAAAEASLGEWRKGLSRDEAFTRHYTPPPRKEHKFIASATPEEKHAIRYRAMLSAAPAGPSEHIGDANDMIPTPDQGIEEAVARIIEPYWFSPASFDVNTRHNRLLFRERALTKARAILSLLGGGRVNNSSVAGLPAHVASATATDIQHSAGKEE